MEGQILISKDSFLNVSAGDVYEDEFKNIILKKELKQIPFFHRSPQIYYRRFMIKHLKNYAKQNKLSRSCLHLAIYLMDIFMDCHIILPERLYLVANVCLLLSAKLEELIVNIPKIEHLNAAINNRYTIKEYKRVEILILKFFKWYVMFPTAAHYTHYFSQAALSKQDLSIDTKTYQGLHFELFECINNCLDEIIEDIHFMQIYSPSQLAAAVIAVARQQIGLSNWTQQLQNITGYSIQQIYDPFLALLKSKCPSCPNCKNLTD